MVSDWYKTLQEKLILLQNITWQRQLPNITGHWTSDILCRVTCLCDQLVPNLYCPVLLKPCISNIIIK